LQDSQIVALHLVHQLGFELAAVRKGDHYLHRAFDDMAVGDNEPVCRKDHPGTHVGHLPVVIAPLDEPQAQHEFHVRALNGLGLQYVDADHRWGHTLRGPNDGIGALSAKFGIGFGQTPLRIGGINYLGLVLGRRCLSHLLGVGRIWVQKTHPTKLQSQQEAAQSDPRQ